MMVSHSEAGVERTDEEMPEVELELDRMAQQVQNLFKFRNFYNQMHLDPDQGLASKVIIELTDLSGGFDLIKRRCTERRVMTMM